MIASVPATAPAVERRQLESRVVLRLPVDLDLLRAVWQLVGVLGAWDQLVQRHVVRLDDSGLDVRQSIPQSAHVQLDEVLGRRLVFAHPGPLESREVGFEGSAAVTCHDMGDAAVVDPRAVPLPELDELVVEIDFRHVDHLVDEGHEVGLDELFGLLVEQRGDPAVVEVQEKVTASDTVGVHTRLRQRRLHQVDDHSVARLDYVGVLRQLDKPEPVLPLRVPKYFEALAILVQELEDDVFFPDVDVPFGSHRVERGGVHGRFGAYHLALLDGQLHWSAVRTEVEEEVRRVELWYVEGRALDHLVQPWHPDGVPERFHAPSEPKRLHDLEVDLLASEQQRLTVLVLHYLVTDLVVVLYPDLGNPVDLNLVEGGPVAEGLDPVCLEGLDEDFAVEGVFGPLSHHLVNVQNVGVNLWRYDLAGQGDIELRQVPDLRCHPLHVGVPSGVNVLVRWQRHGVLVLGRQAGHQLRLHLETLFDRQVLELGVAGLNVLHRQRSVREVQFVGSDLDVRCVNLDIGSLQFQVLLAHEVQAVLLDERIVEGLNSYLTGHDLTESAGSQHF